MTSNEKGHAANVAQALPNDFKQRYDREGPQATSICPVVAVALALDELDHMKAMQCLPEPGALLERLQLRTVDFNLLAGVCAAYLKAREVDR
jgi:hypothetical protein